MVVGTPEFEATMWIDELETTLEANLGRVKGIVAAYSNLSGQGQGRTDVVATDLLRAAVVLLHATLEELVRSSVANRLPKIADAKALGGISLPAKRPTEKFSLVELAEYRGQMVDEVIAQAVAADLEDSNYNNVGQVTAALQRIDVDRGVLDPYQSSLETMMKRRHWIAHRADKNPLTGKGQYLAQSLGKAVVEKWTKLLGIIGMNIIKALRTLERQP